MKNDLKKFMYIFEDGSITLSDTPPSDYDLTSIDTGVLQVIDLEVQQEYAPPGELVDL